MIIFAIVRLANLDCNILFDAFQHITTDFFKIKIMRLSYATEIEV